MLKFAIRKRLVYAAQHNQAPVIYSILKKHPDVINEPAIAKHSFRSETPLAAAAMRGQLQSMTLLLSLGANLDTLSESYYGSCTAIIAAIYSQQYSAVEMLYSMGADLTATDVYNNSPIALAGHSGDNRLKLIFGLPARPDSAEIESKGAEP
jgi:ankyrin repeat protein